MRTVAALLILLSVGSARADVSIRAARPSRADFATALRASRAVDRTLPMRLSASERPRAEVVVRGKVLHEQATVIANVDYETFLKRLDPARWSLNLPQRWGGAVTPLRDTRRPERGGRGLVLQQERMVLGIPALDMTKNSVVTVGRDRARVSWQVTHSDRSLPALGHKTVLMDNGWIEFSRTEDNRVKITSRSAHQVSTLPSLPLEKLAPALAARLTAGSLQSYFAKTVQRYKEIGEGTRTAR